MMRRNDDNLVDEQESEHESECLQERLAKEVASAVREKVIDKFTMNATGGYTLQRRKKDVSRTWREGDGGTL